MDQDTTDASGNFDITTNVPPGVPLILHAAPCEDCLTDSPQVGTTNILPDRIIGHLDVVFPPCDIANSFCDFAEVDFQFMVRPNDPIQLTGVTPLIGSSPILVRDSPEKFIPGTEVTLMGMNLHSNIRVWLYDSDSCVQFPDYCDRYEAEILSSASNGTSVRVRVPAVEPPTRLYGRWFWAVQDLYVGAGGRQFIPSASSFATVPPDYPLIHGFEFRNEGDSVGIDEFLSVFGRNALICAGVPVPFSDECLGCLITDPFYYLYFGVYVPAIKSGNGSCVGMSSTSLRVFHGDLDIESVPEGGGVHYANGFRGVRHPPPPSPTPPPRFLSPPKPARFDGFDLGLLCIDEIKPGNLWAQIRKNHGAQMSEEFIREALKRMNLGADFGGVNVTLTGDPVQVLEEIDDGNILDFVLCMVPEIGKGHCVTPYDTEVVSSTPTLTNIKIYDNRTPESLDQVIEIDRVNNVYRWIRNAAETWSGKGIYAIPIDVYDKDWHAPGVGTILWDFTQFVVLGAADGHYTTPEGEEWGWDEEGNPIDAMSGLALVPLTTPDAETRNVTLIRSVTDTVPTIDVNCRGGDFTFHTGGEGIILQLEALDRPDGDTDLIQPGMTDDRVNSFDYTAGDTPAVVLPRVGMVTGERKRAVFRWMGLSIPGGGAAGFDSLPEGEGGVRFRNHTGTTVHPLLHVQYVNGPMAASSEVVFGPFSIPDGAHHSASLIGWPTEEEVFSELDLDGDGVPEESSTFPAQDCRVVEGSPNDCNRNGINDACEIALGDSRDMDLDGIPDECFVTVVTATPVPMETDTPTLMPGESPTPQFNGFDANRDGKIGPEDLLLLMKEWHESIPR